MTGLVRYHGSNGRYYGFNGLELRPAGTSDNSPAQDLVKEFEHSNLLSGKIEIGKTYRTTLGRDITVKQCHVVSILTSDHVVLFRGQDRVGTNYYYSEFGKALSGYGGCGAYPFNDLVEEITNSRSTANSD